MSLQPRIFRLPNGERLPDIDPGKTPAEIKDHYAGKYPELTNANYVFSKETIEGVSRDVYTFKTRVETKG